MFSSFIRLTIVYCLLAFGFISPVYAQSPRLVVSAADTSANPSSVMWLPIYLQNYEDEVAGVQIRLISSNPEIAWFDFSGPHFDTSGTLLSSWEYLSVGPLDGDSTGITVASLANSLPDNHFYTKGIPPYGGGPLTPLIRIPVRTADSVTAGNETAVIDFVGWIEFATPLAQLIGVVTETVIDTLYLWCADREADSCLLWTEVDPHASPYDSVLIDTSLEGYIDSTQVVAVSGAVTVVQSRGCDITLDGAVGLTDLTCLVQFLFNQNRPVHCLYYGNCRFGDPAVLNLTDVTGLVQYLFLGGPPPQ